MGATKEIKPGQEKSFNTGAEAIVEKNDGGRLIAVRPLSRKTKHRQAAMILAMEKSFGNVSQACALVGVDRNTHYYWVNAKNKDGTPRFAAYIDGIDKMLDIEFDFIQSKAMQRVNEGSDNMIQFMLRTKHKDKGYSDPQGGGTGSMSVIIQEAVVPDDQMTDNNG